MRQEIVAQYAFLRLPQIFKVKNTTYVQLLLGLVLERLAATLKALEDNVVRPLAEEADLARVAHNDGHTLPHIVEVQDTEQLVHLHLAQGLAMVSNGKDRKYLKRS
jgi:hypothetical protein